MSVRFNNIDLCPYPLSINFKALLLLNGKIGEQFSLSDAAVTQASRRMQVLYDKDEALRKLFTEVEARLIMSLVEI